ncbi:hypothetical protein GCM10020000_27930 [Streptomyces olivoverticillatus]
MTAPGMVAEKSMVWRLAGSIVMMRSTSGRKPRSSISSASSRTSALTCARLSFFWLSEVEQSAGRADDDVDALLEGLDLGLVGAAAVDRLDADVADLAQR